jgi:hypothetical protein
VPETFTECSSHLTNSFVTLKHVPSDVPKDHVLHANKELNCSEAWLEFLWKWLQCLTGYKFLVLELCLDFSETPYPLNTPTENNHRVFKSCEFSDHENPSSNSTGYWFSRTPFS